MSVEDTESFLTFVAYLAAAVVLLLMGHLGWRKLRRRHRHRRHIHARPQQHRSTWG